MPTEVLPVYDGVWPELKTLTRLAAPVVLAQVGMMAMGVVDIVMVAPLGEQELASITLGHTWSFGLLVFVLGVSVGLDPFFSQAFGAGQPGLAWRSMVKGLQILCVIAIPVVILHGFAPNFLALLGQNAALIPLGAEYAQVSIIGIVPFILFGIFRQLLQGDGRMMPAAVAILIGNVLNVVGNFAFIYGYFGFPEMGAVGSAWATAVCRWFMFFALVGTSVRVLTAWRAASVGHPPVPAGQLMKTSFPVGIQISFEFWGFSLSTFFMGWFSAAAVAGHMLALNLASVAFMIPLGIGTAAATRVGNLMGAGCRWQPSGWLAVSAGVSVMSVAGLAFWLVPEWLLWPYQAADPAMKYALLFLPLAALFAVFDGAQVVLFGVLRGAGDTGWPALANLLGYYGFGIPLGLVLAFQTSVGPRGLWVGLAASLCLVSLILAGRLIRTGRRGGTLVG